MAQSQIVLTTAATEEGFDSDSYTVNDTERFFQHLELYGMDENDLMQSNTRSAGNVLIPIDVIVWMFGTKEEREFITEAVFGKDEY